MFNSRVLFAALFAGIVMGMLEMLFAALAGSGFWTPLVFIGATVQRDLQTLTPPAPFLAVSVVLGMMGHLLNSVVLGVVFAWFAAPRVRGVAGIVGGGIAFGLIIFVVTWFVVLPLVDPVMLRVDPAGFAISHVAWGATLGGLLARRPAPALSFSGERA